MKPRTLDTEQIALLCNFAEMAVREMEKDKLCSLQRGNSLAAEMTADGMHRAVKALTEGVFVIDVQSPGWKILLMNEQAASFAGLATVPCLHAAMGYEALYIFMNMLAAMLFGERMWFFLYVYSASSTRQECWMQAAVLYNVTHLIMHTTPLCCACP